MSSGLVKVVSGGQTGVDQAGLRAARAAGIPTGGYAPRDWLTEAGPAPWLADFGLVEYEKPAFERPSSMAVGQYQAICYVERTRANARLADHTLWLSWGRRDDSRGYHATYRAATSFVRINKIDAPTPEGFVETRRWLLDGTLNVAGDPESLAKGVGQWAEEYLTEVFRIVREQALSH